eukprot:scaffold44337_cov80-Skeletonema_marinoi.AAC.1
MEQVLQHDNSNEDGLYFHPNEKICLVGHSLGGYLAARFAMRNNNKSNGSGANISKLILASPVGFQPPPPPGQRLPFSNLPPAMRLLDALW